MAEEHTTVDIRNVAFAGQAVPLSCAVETRIPLKRFGDATAYVMTSLPRWRDAAEWSAVDRFALSIRTTIVPRQLSDAGRKNLSMLLAELQEALGKLTVYGKDGISDIMVNPDKAKLPPKKFAEAEANHLMAVEILKKY